LSPTRATAYVGLGANLGDAVATLQAAAATLAAWPGVQAAQGSPVFRSAPVDALGPDFFNGVLRIETSLSPAALLQVLQAVEAQHGRERPYLNAPRTLDLDLLLHGDLRLDTPTLQVPHPRLHQRAFVLLPLLALTPDLQAPGLRPLAGYLAGVADQALTRLDGVSLFGA
jgi:2-amino-4-hydroxy-6-hydroxymethyldihydropteridine diphosphokinase